jgi:hypothetical protein
MIPVIIVFVDKIAADMTVTKATKWFGDRRNGSYGYTLCNFSSVLEVWWSIYHSLLGYCTYYLIVESLEYLRTKPGIVEYSPGT